MSNEVEVTPEVEARFWALVIRGAPGECWEWRGAKSDKGYAMLSTRRGSHIALSLAGRTRIARAALHSCDNPGCVNPAHLRWGTDADNAADMIARRRHHAMRKSQCIHGHPLSGDNLRIRPNGQRSCRQCQRAHMLKHRTKKTEEAHAG